MKLLSGWKDTKKGLQVRIGVYFVVDFFFFLIFNVEKRSTKFIFSFLVEILENMLD